jgi:3',5'-cyclic AMP phosphodiesterase CpdA
MAFVRRIRYAPGVHRWLGGWLGLTLVACSSGAHSGASVGDASTKGDANATRLDARAGGGDAHKAPVDASPDGPADAGSDLGFLEPTATVPPLTSAPVTTTETIVPTHALETGEASMAPSTPSVLSGWVAAGYGATMTGPAEPLMQVAPPGATVPTAGANPTMLLRFVHLPDIQLADDESPNRVCGYDLPASVAGTNGAFRPQEGDECRILDAAVRTINALHATTPISFVLTGGDNADNAQTNEIEWFMKIMDGSPFVKCDSGDYDDPVPGPNNDGKDPFEAAGLDVPWWWVTGNHDVLVQGNYVVDATSQARAVGTMALEETRDYSQPGAPLSAGPLIPDAKRVPLVRKDLMKLVGSDGDGHGVGPSQMSTGKAFYSFDVPNTSLRFIILDTPAETGTDNGVIHQADVTSTIKPLFDQAVADQKLVITASHHSTDQIADGSGLGGTAQADALTETQWEDFLGGYDNLLFSLVGHLHVHRVTYVTPSSGHAFWEVMTGALADYPHEFRLIEIWDDDNGWIRMRATLTNYQTDGNPVAATGRVLAMTDYTSGWSLDGHGTLADRNVELFIPKP